MEIIDHQKFMAFIADVKKTQFGRIESNGWVMFVTAELEEEIGMAGRHIDDFLCGIGSGLSVGQVGLFTWEGSVYYSEDDATTQGTWRRSTAKEIINAASGRNPFTFPLVDA